MPAYEVRRSITIDATPETVFDTVADYGTWTKWSPWLGIDKQATVTVTDNPNSVKSIYSWAGEVVGQGEIEHKQLQRPNKIDDEIRFTKPFKSKSAVSFELQPDGNGTKITWGMNGSLPWFLFWMASNIETYIGMDYERGLKMLKEYIETGEVLSDIEVVGIEPVDSRRIAGVRDSCPTDDVGPTMNAAFAKVKDVLAGQSPPDGLEMISVYHPCDLKHRRFEFTSGYAVSADCQTPPDLTEFRLPEGRALHIRHTGRYENLGNAWSGAHQYARYKKIKLAKRAAFEAYRNDPDNTPEAELVTDIYLYVK